MMKEEIDKTGISEIEDELKSISDILDGLIDKNGMIKSSSKFPLVDEINKLKAKIGTLGKYITELNKLTDNLEGRLLNVEGTLERLLKR